MAVYEINFGSSFQAFDSLDNPLNTPWKHCRNICLANSHYINVFFLARKIYFSSEKMTGTNSERYANTLQLDLVPAVIFHRCFFKHQLA